MIRSVAKRPAWGAVRLSTVVGAPPPIVSMSSRTRAAFAAARPEASASFHAMRFEAVAETVVRRYVQVWKPQPHPSPIPSRAQCIVCSQAHPPAHRVTHGPDGGSLAEGRFRSGRAQ